MALLRALLLYGCSFMLGCAVHSGAPNDSLPERIISSNFTKERDIVYHAGGYTLTGDAYVPEGIGPYPGVLLIHGGSWAGGSRGYMNEIAMRLAENGFSVFNISYRFAPKFLYPAQVEDCINALRWMRQNASKLKMNPDRVASFGYSAGGHLAAMLGTMEIPEKVQAVVAGAAPLDLRKDPDDPALLTFMGTDIRANRAVFLEASPLLNVSAGDAPMFLYHGSLDTIVDPSHSSDMKDVMDGAGIRSELFHVRGLGHISLFIFGHRSVGHAIAFLRRELHSTPKGGVR